MNEPVSNPPSPAWQPFTFGGVAGFAVARLGRLLFLELIVAASVSAAVVWFLAGDYSPVITQAIQKLPRSAAIQSGRLTGAPEKLITENKFLAIAVTPGDTGDIGQSADVQIELRDTVVRISSLLSSAWGCLEFDYGNRPINLGRAELEPWWGAWHPIIWTAAGFATIAVLLLTWTLLAIIYSVPAKFVAWFADRRLSWTAAWRLSSAALMPGAVLMVPAILFYGWRLFDLLGLGFWLGAHLVVGWIYVIGAPCRAPRLSTEPPKKNPFAAN